MKNWIFVIAAIALGIIGYFLGSKKDNTPNPELEKIYQRLDSLSGRTAVVKEIYNNSRKETKEIVHKWDTIRISDTFRYDSSRCNNLLSEAKSDIKKMDSSLSDCDTLVKHQEIQIKLGREAITALKNRKESRLSLIVGAGGGIDPINKTPNTSIGLFFGYKLK